MSEEEKRSETINIKPSVKASLDKYIKKLLPYAMVGADDAVEKLAMEAFNVQPPPPPKSHQVFIDEGLEDEYHEIYEEEAPPAFLKRFVEDEEVSEFDDDIRPPSPLKPKVNLGDIKLRS